MPLSSISDLRLIDLPRFAREDGAVVVAEAPVVPFPIARVFTVSAMQKAVRGHHAHRECTQFMFCPSGAVEAVCDDGVRSASFLLQDGESALIVPPGLWVELTWRTANAVLVVPCDRMFDEADYLRDRQAFVAWRAEMNGKV